MSDLGLDMMKLMSFDGMPGTFESDTVVHEPLQLVEVQSNPTDRSDDLMRDYETARQTMHFQNQMMMDAAKIYLELAKNSESPKMLQAFTTLMQQMSANNKEFMAIHKEMKAITNQNTETKNKQDQTPVAPVNIQNATVFMGSPADLMDQVEDEEAGLIIEGEKQ